MNAAAMIDDLARRGVSLWLNGDELLYDGPDGTVDEPLLAWLRMSRAELVALLQSAETPSVANGRPRPPRKAGRCTQHVEPADWQDARAKQDVIRTTCKRCGGFIGYRPVEPRRKAKP